ncbi:MAG TPA: hypothetical protein GXX37_00910 [Clostridiaceae bacterium]|nr:hypothetical protein [Clostridiaceae bacterium]
MAVLSNLICSSYATELKQSNAKQVAFVQTKRIMHEWKLYKMQLIKKNEEKNTSKVKLNKKYK